MRRITALVILAGALAATRAYPGSINPRRETASVVTAVKITSRVTPAQVKFINDHYDCVMTPLLSRGVREKVRGPLLLLYRSIQDAWTGFGMFDWDWIDSHENMFCHRGGKRIKTVYKSRLMDGSDLVSRDRPDALNHWVNYYAATAAEQVKKFDYDGLFIDSAGHRLWRGAVFGKMPDGYSSVNWRNDRRRSLKFIKSYLPEKVVIFNGLHSGNGAEESLAFTDGGMWETFAFDVRTGRYRGKRRWEEAIGLISRHKDERFISLVSKKRGLTADIQTRLFILASYLLVSSPKVSLTMADLDYGKSGSLLYYPEYDLDLGKARGNYFTTPNGVYARKFEKGLVLVDPFPGKSLAFHPGGAVREVIPAGGGPVGKDGSWQGRLSTRPVSGGIALPSLAAAVLLNAPLPE